MPGSWAARWTPRASAPRSANRAIRVNVAFRGYVQGPIVRRYGLPLAILITGTMFAIAHLDFTLILCSSYVPASALTLALASTSASNAASIGICSPLSR
jgi:CAAX prenyl protease-like protein